MTRQFDKPHIYRSKGWWAVSLRKLERYGMLTFQESCEAARMMMRSQMIRAAGAEANRLADARPYMNPRKG